MKMNKRGILIAVLLIIYGVQITGNDVTSVYASAGTAEWKLNDNQWSYEKGDGSKVQNDWVYYNNRWYYLNESGIMVTGWQQWKGIWYYLNSPNGDMAVSAITPDGYYVGADGAWMQELDNLKENAYDGLSVTAKLDNNGGSAPGDTAYVEVTIKNTGDKTIIYTQGSGSFKTPQALIIKAPGLQPIRPKDHLGIATMDFRRKELQPGENLVFNMNIRLIQPNSQFDTYSHQLLNVNQGYIGEINWSNLKTSYPDLTAAQTGTYSGYAYFRYSIRETQDGSVFYSDDTSFCKGYFSVAVK